LRKSHAAFRRRPEGAARPMRGHVPDPSRAGADLHVSEASEMAVCSRCGTNFDERSYLLLVPSVGGTYDRYDCADAAAGRPPRQLVEDLLREVERLRGQSPEPPDARRAV